MMAFYHKCNCSSDCVTNFTHRNNYFLPIFPKFYDILTCYTVRPIAQNQRLDKPTYRRHKSVITGCEVTSFDITSFRSSLPVSDGRYQFRRYQFPITERAVLLHASLQQIQQSTKPFPSIIKKLESFQIYIDIYIQQWVYWSGLARVRPRHVWPCVVCFHAVRNKRRYKYGGRESDASFWCASSQKSSLEVFSKIQNCAATIPMIPSLWKKYCIPHWMVSPTPTSTQGSFTPRGYSLHGEPQSPIFRT